MFTSYFQTQKEYVDKKPLSNCLFKLQNLEEKNSGNVLEILKECWKNDLKTFFDNKPEYREKLVSFVYDKCEGIGMKTYDELNAIELAIRHTFPKDCYLDILNYLGIQIEKDVSPIKGKNVPSPVFQMLGGGDWKGNKITMISKDSPKLNNVHIDKELPTPRYTPDDVNQNNFHNFNISLINGKLDLPLEIFKNISEDFKDISSNEDYLQMFRMKKSPNFFENDDKVLCIITDPQTDPTEDDATALISIVNINSKYNIWKKIKILVTGCPGSLDSRIKSIKSLKSVFFSFGCKSSNLEIEAAPSGHRELINEFKSQRFLAPYGDFTHNVLETNAINEHKHVIDRIPLDVSQLLIIGQVPKDFFKELTKLPLENLKDVSMQGPGFNIMGVYGKDNIGVQIKNFLHKHKCDFYWSDNTSGLIINKDQVNARFKALSEFLNPNILETRSKCVTSFWATAGNFNQFESQFGNGNGYNYAKHTQELLQELLN
jgi:hypothetical protein